MSQEKILRKFEALLGDNDFISPSRLVSAGIYGSHTALRNAMLNGDLPSVRVSAHRTLIPRDAVLDLLKSRIRGVAV